MDRRKLLTLAPIAAAIAGGVVAGGESKPEAKGRKRRKGRALVIVDNLSGLTALQLVEALNEGSAFVNTDGSVPLPECVHVVWIPEGAKFLDSKFVVAKEPGNEPT